MNIKVDGVRLVATCHDNIVGHDRAVVEAVMLVKVANVQD